mgnify:FL=1|tara:strand:+ start:766 stop:1605 length:840 start_codon:yes stop_codon:yes gene_type:complete
MPKVTQPIALALTRCGIDPTLPLPELLPLFMFTDTGKVRSILGTSVKTEKGEGAGILTAVAYLAASSLSGVNLCPWAGSCAQSCLGHTTGNMKFASVQRAQVLKALWFHFFPESFVETLKAEIRLKELQAMALGKTCAIRLNGSTDILWERYLDMNEFPNVQFYDYTKARHSSRKNLAPNYHLTFSLDEKPSSMAWAQEYLDAGGSVAVVVAGEQGTKLAAAKKAAKHIIANGWRGYPVIDGDKNDARFEDEPGHWVALYAKGQEAQSDTSGFVQRIAS